MKTLIKIALVVVAFAIHTPISAQFTGPGAADQITTTKDIKKNASKLDRTDQMVKLTGSIVYQINAEDYNFQDANGTIRISIKRKLLPETPFDKTTTVTIIGEVDYDMLEGTEIEVEQILIEKKL